MFISLMTNKTTLKGLKVVRTMHIKFLVKVGMAIEAGVEVHLQNLSMMLVKTFALLHLQRLLHLLFTWHLCALTLKRAMQLMLLHEIPWHQPGLSPRLADLE